MKPAAWLVELHRQWHNARGQKLSPSTRPFSRPWEELLDAAGLRTAAERNHAQIEAEALHKHGHLTLHTHRYRKYLVERIDLPVTSEPWLLSLFNEASAGELRSQAVAVVTRFRAQAHPRWPASWNHFCDAITTAFADEHHLGPFSWNHPLDLDLLLTTLLGLTAREWPSETLIRDASTTLGFDSKFLETKRRPLESALAILFGEDTPLESLGLSSSQSRATVHGRLTLHFDDGTIQDFENLRGDFLVSLADLKRCLRATTSADRILTIENAKTTFRQAATANASGGTLLIATSYPNTATKRLLEILPPELPHFHFGDTDASGYAILRSLRELNFRPVERFHMLWQDQENSALLSEHDRRLLPSLKSCPVMLDCLPCLLAMERSGRKGRFEQEALGPPTLNRWPFWNV